MMMDLQDITLESKIQFARDPGEYIVKALSDRFAICIFIKRFVVYYTIIDLQEKIRGPHNFLYNRYDFASEWYIKKCLTDLENETSGVKISEVKRWPLDIISIEHPQSNLFKK